MTDTPEFELNPIVKGTKSQLSFMLDEHRYCANVGGLGSGKSYGVGMKAYWLSERTKGWPGMLISRTGAQLENLMGEVEKVFKIMGLTYVDWKDFKKNKTPYTFTIFNGRRILVSWGGKTGPRADGVTTIYCEVTENFAYKRWAGGNRAWAVIDEIDTMQYPSEVWIFANDRVRIGPFNQTACASTPEGFGFLWDFFDQKPLQDPAARLDRALVRSCTFDNPHINKDYVKNQIMTRDPKTLRAYVYGEFVNLDGTLVYWRFDKALHQTAKKLSDFPLNYIAYVGVDFNKNINAACICIIKDGIVYCVDECYGAADTEALIAQLVQKLKGRAIKIFPDASGYEGIRQLERRFGSQNVIYDAANPPVRVRVASVNEKLSNRAGVPQVLVNPATAPHVFNGLMRQVKDAKGEPDKKAGLDHALDGFGYFIYQNWPAEDQGGTVKVYGNSPAGKYTMASGL